MFLYIYIYLSIPAAELRRLGAVHLGEGSLGIYFKIDLIYIYIYILIYIYGYICLYLYLALSIYLRRLGAVHLGQGGRSG